MSNDIMTQYFYTILTQNIVYEQCKKNYPLYTILITKLSLCKYYSIKILCNNIISPSYLYHTFSLSLDVLFDKTLSKEKK
jgi:hypothetical protein